ncbi:hypothetical protein Tco_1255071 [Tanacetum coccineum]
MHYGKSVTEVESINNSMDLLSTENLLMMSTPGTKSLQLKASIVEWHHNYKHLDWITIRRNDNKLYTFKEGDYKTPRLQDIEDMLLLLVQGKLTNLNVEERLALNVSLRMFTRSIVIQRRAEDLQLAYPNPRGCIYQNKDKKNKLMRIDELHKFSDGTLNDVRTALDDILKRIRMKYLPQMENMRMSRGKLLVGDSLRGETFDCCKGPYDLSYDVLIITAWQGYTSPPLKLRSNKFIKGRLKCKGVTKQIVGVIPKGLALRVVLVDLHFKDESGKGFKL